ncbi:MAG: MerR family transcriptional regulator [Hyphomicrobiaceae bacterium]
MPKSADAFRTISEVADDLDIPKHVLRFWEVKFVQIRPMKRGGGRRYYRPEDMDLLKGIQHLLHREGYTIKGVQKILREQGIEAVKLQGRGEGEVAPPSRPAIARTLDGMGAPPSAQRTRAEPPAPKSTPAGPLAAMAGNSKPAAPKSVAKPVAATPRHGRLDAAVRERILLAIKELESCRSLLAPLATASPTPVAVAESNAAAVPRRSGSHS